MKKFKVHISETFSRNICVEAENFEEALDIADELCNLDIVYLNGKDFGDRYIDILRESNNNVDTSKVYTKEDIKNGISEYETDEEIFRRIQKQYRIEDAKRHCEDLGYDNLNSDDFENIADTFLNNYDCNIAENAQFENIIENYVTKI
jgi:hypothetical protein